MFANRMSLQMLKQLFDRVFTNSFPVRGMPDDLGAALKLAEEGEIQLNPPIEPNPVERRFRGRVDYDKAKCIGCKLCIKVCPANAISYITEEKKIQIHSDRCCFCAQCTEICPVNCLAMSDTYLFSSYDRKAQVVNDSGKFDIKLENIIKSSVAVPEVSTEEEPAEKEAETAKVPESSSGSPVKEGGGESTQGEAETKIEAAEKAEEVKEPGEKESAEKSSSPEKSVSKKTSAKKTTKKTTKTKKDSE